MDYRKTAEELCDTFRNKEARKLADLLDKGSKGIYVILRILRECNGEVFAGDIAQAMDISTARVAAALNTLSEKRYIERKPSAADGRKTVVEITADGLRALNERENAVLGLIESFLRKLTVEEAQTFITITAKLFGQAE